MHCQFASRRDLLDALRLTLTLPLVTDDRCRFSWKPAAEVYDPEMPVWGLDGRLSLRFLVCRENVNNPDENPALSPRANHRENEDEEEDLINDEFVLENNAGVVNENIGNINNDENNVLQNNAHADPEQNPFFQNAAPNRDAAQQNLLEENDEEALEAEPPLLMQRAVAGGDFPTVDVKDTSVEPREVEDSPANNNDIAPDEDKDNIDDEREDEDSNELNFENQFDSDNDNSDADSSNGYRTEDDEYSVLEFGGEKDEKMQSSDLTKKTSMKQFDASNNSHVRNIIAALPNTVTVGQGGCIDGLDLIEYQAKKKEYRKSFKEGISNSSSATAITKKQISKRADAKALEFCYLLGRKSAARYFDNVREDVLEKEQKSRKKRKDEKERILMELALKKCFEEGEAALEFAKKTDEAVLKAEERKEEEAQEENDKTNKDDEITNKTCEDHVAEKFDTSEDLATENCAERQKSIESNPSASLVSSEEKALIKAESKNTQILTTNKHYFRGASSSSTCATESFENTDDYSKKLSIASSTSSSSSSSTAFDEPAPAADLAPETDAAPGCESFGNFAATHVVQRDFSTTAFFDNGERVRESVNSSVSVSSEGHGDDDDISSSSEEFPERREEF